MTLSQPESELGSIALSPQRAATPPPAITIYPMGYEFWAFDVAETASRSGEAQARQRRDSEAAHAL